MPDTSETRILVLIAGFFIGMILMLIFLMRPAARRRRRTRVLVRLVRDGLLKGEVDVWAMDELCVVHGMRGVWPDIVGKTIKVTEEHVVVHLHGEES